MTKIGPRLDSIFCVSYVLFDKLTHPSFTNAFHWTCLALPFLLQSRRRQKILRCAARRPVRPTLDFTDSVRMPSTVLHFVLLAAVAASQLVGGVSCCCLWRALGSSVFAQPVLASDEIASSVLDGCPSCSQSAGSNGTANATGDSPRTCQADSGDDSCRCAGRLTQSHSDGRELGTVAAVDLMPLVVSHVVFVAADSKPRVYLPLTHDVDANRNWNAFACVWRI